ncbi:MAG: TatD family hydrolase [Gemmataceae bacterium]
MITHLIDTHAHLDDERFASDLPAVLERANGAGVSHIVTIGTTATTSLANIILCQKHPTLSAAVGLQPNNLAEAGSGDWDAIRELVQKPGVRAVGETGLDRHWDYTPFAQQEDYFARHLELARIHKLPVVIHCRKAEADVVRMLRQDFERHGPVCGVMHSFTGDQATAEACLAMGLYISFAGMVTYKNAQDLREVAKQVPLDRLLIETDSPYLAPVPVRGQRNEPSFVVHTATVLAALRGMGLAHFAEATTRNARALFEI